MTRQCATLLVDIPTEAVAEKTAIIVVRSWLFAAPCSLSSTKFQHRRVTINSVGTALSQPTETENMPPRNGVCSLMSITYTTGGTGGTRE